MRVVLTCKNFYCQADYIVTAHEGNAVRWECPECGVENYDPIPEELQR